MRRPAAVRERWRSARRYVRGPSAVVTCPWRYVVHRLGMPWMPCIAPARPPATAATVSVSPPRSIAATTASANESWWRTAHTACARQVHTVPLGRVVSSGVHVGAEHRAVAVLVGGEPRQPVLEGDERVVAGDRGGDHHVVQRRAPAGGGVTVGDLRRLAGGGDRHIGGLPGEVHRGRRRPHQRPVPRSTVGVAPVVIGCGLVPRQPRGQHRSGLDADVVRLARPRPEALEQVGAVDAAVRQHGLGLHDRHLRVVGELARRPPEARRHRPSRRCRRSPATGTSASTGPPA